MTDPKPAWRDGVPLCNWPTCPHAGGNRCDIDNSCGIGTCFPAVRLLVEALRDIEAAVPLPSCDDCDAIEIARAALPPEDGQ